MGVVKTPTPFTIDLTNPAAPSVTIDGVDVTASVTKIFLEADQHGLPTLTLQIAHGARVEGLAHIGVSTVASYADVADEIRSLDPGEIEHRASYGSDLSDDLMAATVQAVADMVAELDSP